MSERTVCCIGTTEPWNVAGLGLDARVLARFGVRAVTVVAGISAQDRAGVHAAQAVDTEVIAAQFASLAGAPIDAYRIGALLDAASVATVARALAQRPAPAVYDPVLGPSGGGAFAGAATRAAIVADLFARVTLATPNLAEAQTLAGLSDATPAAAARALLATGLPALLITGIAADDQIADLLFVPASEPVRFAAARIPGDVRGTGCMLAAAVAAELAQGRGLEDAIASARSFVRARIADATEIGGMRAMTL